MALKKVPTLLVLFANIVLGAIWAMIFQAASLQKSLTIADSRPKRSPESHIHAVR